VDIAEAVTSLPEVYRRALELAFEGRSESDVAVTLEVPAEAVNPLLRLAAAKLASLLTRT
jgi:DNA-directed RNA polymerase specialized sigma24 family protein